MIAPAAQSGMPYGGVTIVRTFDERATITLSCDNRSLGGIHTDHGACTLGCNDICTKSHRAMHVPEIAFDAAALSGAMESLADSDDGFAAAWKAMKGATDIQARLNQPVSIDLDHWNSLPCAPLERTYGLRKHTIVMSTPDGPAVVAEVSVAASFGLRPGRSGWVRPCGGSKATDQSSTERSPTRSDRS